MHAAAVLEAAEVAAVADVAAVAVAAAAAAAAVLLVTVAMAAAAAAVAALLGVVAEPARYMPVAGANRGAYTIPVESIKCLVVVWGAGVGRRALGSAAGVPLTHNMGSDPIL